VGDLALNVNVRQDTLGRFLSFAQVMAQTRVIEELQAEREQIQYQIAELQQSNVIAEQNRAINQKRLELEKKERAERAAQLERLRHLRNILAEATLELEDLQAELDGRPAT
jgi:predicted RNase H-like nuclease (RuvC/YqgF family)